MNVSATESMEREFVLHVRCITQDRQIVHIFHQGGHGSAYEVGFYNDEKVTWQFYHNICKYY